jgi:epsilon-lactone hydrolase
MRVCGLQMIRARSRCARGSDMLREGGPIFRLRMQGALVAALFMIYASRNTRAVEPPQVEADGTIHVPAFLLPESAYLSPETRAELKHQRETESDWVAYGACGPAYLTKPADAAAFRQCQEAAFLKTETFKRLGARYPDIAMTPQLINGVYTQTFVPKAGASPNHRDRVLINVHGGGFVEGSRTFSYLESVPIASIGQIRVVSVDYRMGPDHTFPAASEDVAKVYRELLKTYGAQNIGLYGCSSGAVLTAQSIAWFQHENLPLPAAVGMFCHGAPRYLHKTGALALQSERNKWIESDAGYLGSARSGINLVKIAEHFPYYSGVRVDNPLASPGDYDAVMAKFPPTLFVSGSRDWCLSGVLVTHEQLSRLGGQTDLHVWEGMAHAFIYDADLPESREAYDVIVRFFNEHLGG